MRNVFIALFLVVATPIFATVPMSFSATVDFGGNMHTSVSDFSSDNTVDTGVTIGAEYAVNNQFGFGAKYQLERNDFSFIPVYGYASATFDKMTVQGNLGYNLLTIKNSDGVDVNGGIYIGLGGSYAFTKNIKAIGEFSLNQGQLSANDVNIDLSYSKMSLGVAYTLD